MRKPSYFLSLCITVVTIILLVLVAQAQRKIYWPSKSDLDRFARIRLPPHAEELRLEYSFPLQKDIDKGHYFWDPYGMVEGPEEALYILDYQASAVMRFAMSGAYHSKFGQNGQGPGDLGRPILLLANERGLAVAEAGNMRISFFDYQGHYKRSLRLFRWYISGVLDRDDTLFGMPEYFDSKDTKLIEVLSPEGKLTNAFGEVIPFRYDQDILNRAFLVLTRSGDLIVGFEQLPIIRRYDRSGRLKAEFKIDTLMMKVMEKWNADLNALVPEYRVGYIQPIKCLSVLDDFIYTMYYYPPRVVFYQLSGDGKLLKTFWANVGEKYSSGSFIVRTADSRLQFLLIERSYKTCVDVFGQKLDEAGVFGLRTAQPGSGQSREPPASAAAGSNHWRGYIPQVRIPPLVLGSAPLFWGRTTNSLLILLSKGQILKPGCCSWALTPRFWPQK